MNSYEIKRENLQRGMPETMQGFIVRSIWINQTGWSLASMRLKSSDNDEYVKTLFEIIDGFELDSMGIWAALNSLKVFSNSTEKYKEVKLTVGKQGLYLVDVQEALGSEFKVMSQNNTIINSTGESNNQISIELIFTNDTGHLTSDQNKVILTDIFGPEYLRNYLFFSTSHECIEKIETYNTDDTLRLVVHSEIDDLETYINNILKQQVSVII